MQYQVISADDHLDLRWMGRDTWTSRVEDRFKDRAPHVVQTDKGPTWMCEGRSLGRWGTQGIGTSAGRRMALEIGGVFTDEELRPSDQQLRLQDMDRDGIDASVIFGPIGGVLIEDSELRTACYRAYNDWLVEFCSAAPGRLIGVGQLPANDPATAGREFERLAKLGIREVLLTAAVANPPIWHESWDAIWAVANETRVPVAFHLHGSETKPPGPGESLLAGIAAKILGGNMDMIEPLLRITFSGTFEKFPNLRLVLAESGVGWIPWVLSRMDRLYEQFVDNKAYWDENGGIPLKMPPSEYFKRQVRATFEVDSVGMQLLPMIGDHCVMWGSDYPHADSTWPNSRAYLDRQMAGVADDIRRKVTCENARVLYGLN